MIIPEIVSQYFEEASFLWLLRDRAVSAPHYSLRDLAKLDDRVEAHIDGLRIAGHAGWELVESGLAEGESGGVFAAAVLAFESLKEDRMQLVVEAGIAAPDLSRGLISALGWLGADRAGPLIDRMLSAELPVVRRVGVAASAVHRRDPGASLRKALLDDDLPLRARAAKAVGELSRSDLVPLLRENLRTENDACRFYSSWSGTLLGEGDCFGALQTLAVPGNPYGEEAVRVSARRLDVSAALSWQTELSRDPATVRHAIVCAGTIGDPVLIPWLVSQMEDPGLARVAGESFALITSVDLAYGDLDGEKPEGFEVGPTENPEDEDVAMDPDEDLPWPNPELIHKWWDRHEGQFQNGGRYLMGKPVSVDHLHGILRTGRQRQRAAAALELAMLNPGQPLFEVRAPGFRQQQILGW